MATGGYGFGNGEVGKPRKKTKKNAYVCFVLARKLEEENKGNQLSNSLKDLIPIFSEEWSRLDDFARAQYKAMADSTKTTGNSNGSQDTGGGASANVRLPPGHPDNEAWRNKKTSQHMTIGEIMDREAAVRQHQQNTRMDILGLVDDSDGDPTEHIFVLIEFSVYCVTDYMEYVPAEVGLAAFSLRRGLIDNYSSLIDPGQIPIGCAAEARHNRQTQDLPEPPFAHSARKYDEIMANIDEFIKRYPTFKQKKTFLFALRDEFEKITGCLKWLCERAGVERKFYLYPYPLLLQTLANTGREIYKVEKSQQLAEGEKLELGDPKGIDSGRFQARRIPHTTAHELARMKVTPADASDYTSYQGILRPRPPRIFNVCHPVEKPVVEPEPVYEDCDVFMFETMALEFLQSQDMAHYAELGCPHHMVNSERVSKCALNIVNRYALNSLDILVEYWGVIPVEGSHFPLRSSDREMAKRRSILKMWGIHGYSGLQGFEDSIDFSRDDDARSSSSLSSYTSEVKGYAPKGATGGLLSHSSRSSLDSLSDTETRETETEPTTADSEYGYGGYSSSAHVASRRPNVRALSHRPDDVSNNDLDADKDNLWFLREFDGEDTPRALFRPLISVLGRSRPAPSFASSSAASTSSRQSSVPNETDADDEASLAALFGTKKNENGSEYNFRRRRIPRAPEPVVNSGRGEYPHFFDPLMWSFGRGVRIPLPEETQIECHNRHFELKSLQERREKFYPVHDL